MTNDIINQVEKPKLIEITNDEFEYLSKIVDELLAKGDHSQEPNFIIMCGGVGSGKSTIRKQKYNEGYVVIDAGEVYLKLTDNEKNKIDKIDAFIDFVGSFLVSEAIEKKKNIVIEVLLDKQQPIMDIIDKMLKKGYKNNLEFIECDPVEAWKRHLGREKNNISSYNTQDQTMAWFSHHLK